MNTRSRSRVALLATLSLFILFPVAQSVFSQPAASWDDVPSKVRERKSFKRFEWFYRQRALPDIAIPDGALESARKLAEEKELLRTPAEKLLDLTWSPIGPTGVVSTYPSQWGVVSGRVRALAVHPTSVNTAYIGPAAGGIWKTTDGGTTWSDVGVSLASLTFGAIAIDPGNSNVVYAGAGESIRYWNTTTYSGKGIYKSTNAGASWTQITSGFGTTTHFGALRVSPTNSNMVFAALGSGYYYASSPGNEGLWRSTNAGTTWTRTLNVDDGFDVLPHPTTINLVFGATGGAASTAGVYRSTDTGAGWTKMTTGLPASTTIERVQLAISPAGSNLIYALIYNTSGTVTVYRSSDTGTTWSAVSSSYSTAQGWYDLTLAVNPANPGEVYIGTEELRRSTDSARTFSYVGGSYWSQAMHVDFHVMAFAPSNASYRYVGCDGGIYRSTDGGLNWGQLNSVLPTLQYYRIGSHPTNQNTIMGGSQDNGVYRTTNGGVGNWTLVSTGDGMECFYDYTTPATVYASTQYGALVKSTTGGGYGTFTGIKPTTGDNWAWTAPFFIHPTTSSTIYTASQRPWRSTDGGGTWTDLVGSTVTTYTINTMAQSPVTPNNMILAASEGLGSWPATPPVFVSTNGGTSWTNVTANIGGTARFITRVLFHPTAGNTCFVVRSGFSSGNKIWRSTNLGTAWTNVSGDLPDVPHNDLFVDPANPTEMYTANDLGVYRTTNGGTTWTRQGNGMPYVPAIDFDYFNAGGVRLLRAATHGRAAYEAALAGTQSVQVTVPNGGEVWRIGTSQTIQWNSSGFTGNVAIDLSRNGGVNYESVSASTANDGSESWVVTGAATPAALIRVSSVDYPAVRDSSNSMFNIIQASISVSFPNGGESWLAGTLALVQWTSTNLTGNVTIELSRDGGSTYATLFPVTADDGVEAWPVTGPGTTQARIRITSIDIPTVSDVSDAVFTITQPTLTMVSPNGGETWPVTSIGMVQWNSSVVTGPVRIALSRNGGLSFPEVLFASTPDDGAEPWQVSGPPTTAARIRVTSLTDTTVTAASAADFTIQQPAISMLAPNGGEIWQVDSVSSFQWSAPQLTGNVSIRVSRNGGATFETLFASTANDGTESWTVTGPATAQARARISSIVDSTILVQSAGDFFIGTTTGVSAGVAAGWNMLSVPVTLPDLLATHVFPSASSHAFTFAPDGYVVRDTLDYGEGYWLNYASAGTVALVGGTRSADSIRVSAGWNMIGSISSTVPVDSVVEVPDSIVQSAYYFFNGTTYVPVDSLQEMRGYWVKANSPGILVLRSGTTAAPAWTGPRRSK